MTVHEIIIRAGGAVRLANRLQGTPHERSASTIRKWAYNGVPRSHYGIVSELSGVSIADIHLANSRLDEPRPSECVVSDAA